MHVGVEEAVAQRMTQKALDHRPRQLLEIVSLASSAARLDRCVPSIHSSASTSWRCGPNPPSARENRDRPSCFLAISDSAAASSRKSISSATERRIVAAAFDQPQALRFGEKRFGRARREGERVLIDLETPFDARPQHLDGDLLRALIGLHLGTMHLRNRCGGDSRAKRDRRPPSTAGQRRVRWWRSLQLAWNGGIRSCRLSSSCATIGPTTSGRVARNCPKLHISRAKLRERGREPARRDWLCSAARSGARGASPTRAGKGSNVGSTSLNTPSRANT